MFTTIIRASAAALLLCVTNSTTAANPIQPPSEYVHMYSGNLTIKWFKYWDVEHKGCGLDHPNSIVESCAQYRPVTRALFCTIVLPLDVVDADYLWLLWIHELAHCNGWPNNHPNGHYYKRRVPLAY